MTNSEKTSEKQHLEEQRNSRFADSALRHSDEAGGRRSGNSGNRRSAESGDNELMIIGRRAAAEALKANDNVDKLYVQEGIKDGPVSSIIAEAKKRGILTVFVPKEKLDLMSGGSKHQGVILNLSAVTYAEVDDILEAARQKKEPPFIIVLDSVQDPHNLGAIIRTANLAGAHGVIIPKHRNATVNATVAKCSAGALSHTPVAKVTNISQTLEYLKERGVWTACACMEGTVMYDLDFTGPIALVMGNEGSGARRLVKKNCDMTVSVPMKGDIDSLNVSVAAGVLSFEVFRQRRG